MTPEQFSALTDIKSQHTYVEAPMYYARTPNGETAPIFVEAYDGSTLDMWYRCTYKIDAHGNYHRTEA